LSVPLVAAGSLAVLAAGVHGFGGEILVVRKLFVGTLPSTAFGGPRMTMAMVHVTWHIVTIAFLCLGVALLLSGLVLDGDAARGIALVCAAAFSGFAAIAVGLGAAHMRSLRAMSRHLGPAALTATAVLAWWGAI
jgi:hypothetical protein